MSNLRVVLLLSTLLVAVPGLAAQVPDPMRPPLAAQTPATTTASPALLVLNSTLISRGRRVATINGRRYALGDAIGDRRLVSIEPTAVVLERNDQRLRLELLPSTVRKPAGE